MTEFFRLADARLKLFGESRKLRGCVWPGDPVVHVCYHKALTVFSIRLFTYLQAIYDLKVCTDSSQPQESTAHSVHVNTQGVLPPTGQLPFRGTHIIRDPRDLIVSAYFYHLRTNEPWCAKPDAANDDLPGDVSYQEKLRSLSLEDGLIYEMNHVAGLMIDRMCSWDYGDSGFLELRFEQIVGNEESAIQAMLQWYGAPASDGSSIAHYLRFLGYRQVRRLGQSGNSRMGEHLGKEYPVGRWEKHFTDSVKQAFNRRFPGALQHLGYE